MKYQIVRVIEKPVISDDNRHYFFNGDRGLRAILAEDLPRPNPPVSAIVDDMIEQQFPDVLYCDICSDELPCDCIADCEAVYG